MNLKIPNLLEKVLQASHLPRHAKFTQWARFVHDVDLNKPDVEAFQGNFIGNGPVTVALFEPQLILASTAIPAGDRIVRHFRVLILERDGALTLTRITTHDASPGWVKRIADDVLDLLASIAQPEPDQAGPVRVTIEGRALDDLAALRVLTTGIPDVQIVQEALACYRAELSFGEVER